MAKRSPSATRPLRRASDLIVRELADETIVFDERSAKAHCLNTASARVWKLCDGTRTPEAIARELSLDGKLVEHAIDLLARSKLLERATAPRELAGLTRREAMRVLKTVAIGVAVPAVVSIVAPTVAEAASCVPLGGICGHNDSQICCAGLRCTSDHCVR